MVLLWIPSTCSAGNEAKKHSRYHMQGYLSVQLRRIELDVSMSILVQRLDARGTCLAAVLLRSCGSCVWEGVKRGSRNLKQRKKN